MSKKYHKNEKLKLDERFLPLFYDDNLSNTFLTDIRTGEKISEKKFFDFEEKISFDKTAIQSLRNKKNNFDHKKDTNRIKKVDKKSNLSSNTQIFADSPIQNEVPDVIKKETDKKIEGLKFTNLFTSHKSELSDLFANSSTDDDDNKSEINLCSSDNNYSDESNDQAEADSLYSAIGSEDRAKLDELRKAAWGLNVETKYIENDGTSRIAILGCDWNNVTVEDIYNLCHTVVKNSSYKMSDDGKYLTSDKVISVSLYRSKFGDQFLKEEAMNGPKIDIINSEIKNKEIVDEQTDLAIRKYQRERSLCYYVVVDLDKVESAIEIYEKLDGIDIEFAIDSLNLQFILDDIKDFNFEPESVCNKLPIKYKCSEAIGSALKHSKSKLLFDETSKKRSTILRKKFTAKEIDELDLDDYLASEVSDSDTSATKLREILLCDLKKDKISDIDNPDEDILPNTKNKGKKKSQAFEIFMNQNDSDNNDNNSSHPSEYSTENELLIDFKKKSNKPDIQSDQLSDKNDESKSKSKKNLLRQKKQKKKNKIMQEEIEHKKSLAQVQEDQRFKLFFSQKEHFLDATEVKRARKR